jgi:hypothetical protein
MANANAQAGKTLVIAEAFNRITQTIVTTVAAAFFKAGNPWFHIQLIVYHKNVFRRNLVEPSHCSNGLATEIHKSAGYQQAHIATSNTDSGGIAKKFALVLEFGVQRFCQLQNQVGPDIMSRPFIVGAGVSQPYY